MRPQGPVTAVEGPSGDGTPARNLRGKNVPVEEGATEIRIRFPRVEADGDYAVFVDQSWLAARSVTGKAAEGFLVRFSAPAPKGATLDWMIVR